MDLLDRLLGHDAWTTRQLLLRCEGLTDGQLDQEFDIGYRTVRATLLHTIRNVEAWSDLMSGRPVRADQGKEAHGRSVPGMIARLNRAAADLAVTARAVARRGGWDERWVDRLADPPAELTYGGSIAHVITHGMHHRAQVLYMLRRLGVRELPEGDVLSWEQEAGDAAHHGRHAKAPMSKAALFIRHRALPGKRDEVRRIWEKHLQPNIATNAAHEAYFYCYDDGDPDTICVYQQYADRASSQEFLAGPWYAAYVDAVTPLLAGPPEVRAATPVWAKDAARG